MDKVPNTTTSFVLCISTKDSTIFKEMIFQSKCIRLTLVFSYDYHSRVNNQLVNTILNRTFSVILNVH